MYIFNSDPPFYSIGCLQSLPSIQSTVCTVHHPAVHCTVNPQYNPPSVQSTFYTVYRLYCLLLSTICSVYSTVCIIYRKHCIICIVHPLYFLLHVLCIICTFNLCIVYHLYSLPSVQSMYFVYYLPSEQIYYVTILTLL